MRRHDFILSFCGRFSGLREAPPPRRLGPYLYDSTPIWDVEVVPLGSLPKTEFKARPVRDERRRG